MDIITLFQELPDIKTIFIDKEYLVVDKNDRPKITKKGKVNPKKIRKVQRVKIVRETLTSYGLEFIPQSRNEFRLDLFNDPMLILKTDFWNIFQVIEELDNFEKRPNIIPSHQLIDELTSKATIDEFLGTEENKKNPPTVNQILGQISDMSNKSDANKKGKKTRIVTNQTDAE